jgi:hypothetical protein
VHDARGSLEEGFTIDSDTTLAGLSAGKFGHEILGDFATFVAL